jgi:hypothetical protein
MTELKYSPSELQELYNAPRNFKAFLYGLIEFKLEQLADEKKEMERNKKKGGK